VLPSGTFDEKYEVSSAGHYAMSAEISGALHIAPGTGMLSGTMLLGF
jgi:hypothetical protein